MSEENEDLRIDQSIEEGKKNYKKWAITGVAVVVSLGIGIGGAFLYDSISRDSNAHNELNEIIANSGSIEPVNTDVREISDDNYALGVSSLTGQGDYPENGTFILRNDKDEYQQTVDIYLDYSDSRSRDFFFMNENNLRSLVESGQIELRIHPVPSNHPYSMYAAETLAQTMHRYPEKFWSVNTSMLQLIEEVEMLEEDDSANEIGVLIESELSRYHDIQDIDYSLIIEGMFFDWLLQVENDEKLTTANSYPPIVYTDDSIIDESLYYNPEDLNNAILNPEIADDSE